MRVIIPNEAPRADVEVVLNTWDVVDAIIQDPEFKVYPEFQVTHIELIEFEHFSQFCTLQLITISLICFCTLIEISEIEEVTSKSYSVSALTLGALIVKTPVTSSIDTQDGTFDKP